MCMSKSHRSLCVLFFRTGAGLCIYHLFMWSNLNFLHISQWITLPTQSCLVLYSFCANLLHSLIMWLMDYYYYYYYYYYYLLLQRFSHQCYRMVFHWSLSDSKSPQVSKTRLRILAVLSNAVIWIVSTRSPTSKSSRPFNNPLVILPKVPITIGTIVTFMFQFSSKVEVLILLFTFLQIYSVVRRDSKVDNFANSLFFYYYYKVWSFGGD